MLRRALQYSACAKRIPAQGLCVVFILGIAKIIDAGTGVNSVIIATSTLWKFEFYTGVVLLKPAHSVSIYFNTKIWHYRSGLCRTYFAGGLQFYSL